MLVANVDGNNVASFRVDTQTGALTPLETTPVNQASYVGIVSLLGK